MLDLNSIIRKHVLKNAFDYGKANPGSVVGKVIAEFPDCKKDMKVTMSKINQEIMRISKLSKIQIENEMHEFEYTEKKEEKKSLELPNAIVGKVVTRFPPEPSGYPHIGHAKAAWLDFESARTYSGHMILRFDDTNPEKESIEYVNAIKSGLKWLGINWSEETYTSDNLKEIYLAAEKLISKGNAYICTCSQDQISKGRSESIECSCRKMPIKDNLNHWNNMLTGKFNEGECILRFKGDLNSENTVMRDPTLTRIIITKHYKQGIKYRIWPSYDLAVCVMDHLEGITHSMRSKEYELRDELSVAIYSALDWTPPELIGFSRLNIKNAPISKRLLLPLVQGGKVLGWNDPRLPTLEGLKRRGILPEAIKEFVLSFGLSKVESEPDWEALLALNRKILDPTSPHYFFVPNPVLVRVDNIDAAAALGMSKGSIKLRRHPKKDLGERTVPTSKEFLIPKADSNFKTGDIVRLKDLCNVAIEKIEDAIIGSVAPDALVEKKIQWVDSKTSLECEILVPKDLLNDSGNYNPESLETILGRCEYSCSDLNVGDTVQFERFGFCRLDSKSGKKLVFVYSC